MQDYNCYEVQCRRPAHAVLVAFHVIADNLEASIPIAREGIVNTFGSEAAERVELVSVKEIATAVIGLNQTKKAKP